MICVELWEKKGGEKNCHGCLLLIAERFLGGGKDDDSMWDSFGFFLSSGCTSIRTMAKFTFRTCGFMWFLPFHPHYKGHFNTPKVHCSDAAILALKASKGNMFSIEASWWKKKKNMRWKIYYVFFVLWKKNTLLSSSGLRCDIKKLLSWQ